MNGVLFRRSARSLWKTWVVFAAVLSLYVSMITAMFDPKLNATLDEIVTAMPQLMNMVGMQAGSSSLGGFLINYLYGFLLLLLPLVFSILAANRLVARWVDTGSMAYLLASPNTRARVARTQALVLIAGGTLLTAYCTALAVGCAAAMFPGELDVPAYLVVNAGLLCLHLALGGFCFFASCLFNESRLSVALGAGVPVLFFLIRMLANMGGRLEKLKYATVFTLFDPTGLFRGVRRRGRAAGAGAWFLRAGHVRVQPAGPAAVTPNAVLSRARCASRAGSLYAPASALQGDAELF